MYTYLNNYTMLQTRVNLISGGIPVMHDSAKMKAWMANMILSYPFRDITEVYHIR